MSLHLEFEPHSWYKGFAIKKTITHLHKQFEGAVYFYNWQAYTDNGNTYQIDELEASTLKELKQLITEYRS